MNLLTQPLIGGCGKEGPPSAAAPRATRLDPEMAFADALAQNLEGTHAARK